MNIKPKSMHCDWAAMKEETYWDKTDGIAELRGRLERIRELFEGATQAPDDYSRGESVP